MSTARLFPIACLISSVLLPTAASACNFIPQGGFYINQHLGKTFIGGGGCVQYSGKGYKGTYSEAAAGEYGYGLDYGLTFSSGGSLSFGLALSGVQVNDEKSEFEKDRYIGLSGKISFFLGSLRGGVYYGEDSYGPVYNVGYGIGL